MKPSEIQGDRAELATDDGIEIVKTETHALEIGLPVNNAADIFPR